MHKSLPWLRRFLLRRYHRQVKEAAQREAQRMNQDWLQSLLEGFDLIQNRVRRSTEVRGDRADRLPGPPGRS